MYTVDPGTVISYPGSITLICYKYIDGTVSDLFPNGGAGEFTYEDGIP